ncbi:MAG: hypothetical protein SAK29_36830 [Scytonema sp. PMC 1069.18]|nr:hypothetical protein [Scytonema sp. PMC 1069.18]MEC4887519.1 hypothetical protein [Scytonema sp. PMC 1070.18]
MCLPGVPLTKYKRSNLIGPVVVRAIDFCPASVAIARDIKKADRHP